VIQELREKLLSMYANGTGDQKEFEDTLALLVGLCMLDFAVNAERKSA